MSSPKYLSHIHSGRARGHCVYCDIDVQWEDTAQSIRAVPGKIYKTIVLCINKHASVLNKEALPHGCPICGLKDPTIHSGASYISGAQNLIRRTCAECDEVYFSKYGAGRLHCDMGHAILADDLSVRVNVIAALECVLGQTADDWFFHCYTDFHACAMGYKVAAFIGNEEEYRDILARWKIDPQSTEYSIEKIIDPRAPNYAPYPWLIVRIDPNIAHNFVECVQRFIAATNLHEWLQTHRNQDIQGRLDEYMRTGQRFSLDTVRPPFPAPKLLTGRRKR